ncbi:bactofilin family protein [Hydromonas duriensis]|uniref:Cytoskeletal protein CcmA (Bactofilin family) n=1 Tax=Hydromonas duriensis TaxID=1527608 RepID=A0A4R6Y8H8_9BURK|nr:polymer-forming cytoskeletal protein [Hydromonas duriensis]TDR31697.1 cytoskeletal protein CcmA (bactofilin family) [Hydromonas duriensis]
MFSKKDVQENTSRTYTTVIGEDCTINGHVDTKAYIKIDGQILGNLSANGGVVLGEKGYIKGDINSNEVTVYGRVDGHVHANSLQLKNSSTIVGNIETKTLQIDPGAVYQGNVTMHVKTDNPTEPVNSNS